MSEEYLDNSIENNINLNNNKRVTFSKNLNTQEDEFSKNPFNKKIDETLEERLEKSKETYLENQVQQFNKLKYDMEMQGRRIMELDSSKMKLHDENLQLMKRIEEYQKINKDWEFKVFGIRNNILDLEENNKGKNV